MGKIATTCGILLLLAVSNAGGAERPTVDRLCAGDSYEQALCAFHNDRLGEAERELRRLAEGDPSPRALRARYFLARTLMKQERWEEAGRELIHVFSLDPGFYREWGCDFLLGETRRRRGLD